MGDVFFNTSVLWAYNLINPELGAAKADIWRMAVLWKYGGVYIDADATVNQNFNKATFLFPLSYYFCWHLSETIFVNDSLDC